MALLFMLAIKMIANNFAACCCSHDVVASIAMSFKFITEHCVAISANSTTNHKQKVNNNTWLHIYMERNLRLIVIMIEVNGRHTECTYLKPEYSQMPTRDGRVLVFSDPDPILIRNIKS